ncbi:MAG: pyruvate, phosphate dikinase [Candidatus Diapherotrites archaeon]|nr:pyruvate, phosphate dikinase [Candidatus Diapherotrites archaeon]
MIGRNLMVSADVLAKDYLPFCAGETKALLKRILESDLRMYRVREVSHKGVTYVYNFEVDAEEELDKNFIIFSSRYTPVLVSNSHAAVVARGMGKPCVAGCEAIQIDLDKKIFKVGDIVVKEFDWITIDGNTGSVILGQAPMIEPSMSTHLKTLLKWADGIRKLGVKTNADNPVDAAKAREFGAEGIGLCRTEHMFMAKERVPIVHKMIMAANEKERKKALNKLLPMQRKDFYELFKIMNGLPVIIRLLDPPLHEFLPNKEALLEEIRKLECEQCKKKITLKELEEKAFLLEKARMLSEANPMLGHRGVRLGLTFPEIYEMQVQAIIEAAIKAMREGYRVKLQIMIPLVGIAKELKLMRELVERKASEVMEREGVKVRYKVGTMIELPRACVVADEIAKHADFFSFGTNDLTQTTFGFSRDDAEAKFLPQYIERGILEANPFAQLDTKGVGSLMKIAITKGRRANKEIELGICGEHGGNPQSIEFCHKVGLDYVSCSPYRVPIARLAAAQAAIRCK